MKRLCDVITQPISLQKCGLVRDIGFVQIRCLGKPNVLADFGVFSLKHFAVAGRFVWGEWCDVEEKWLWFFFGNRRMIFDHVYGFVGFENCAVNRFVFAATSEIWFKSFQVTRHAVVVSAKAHEQIIPTGKLVRIQSTMQIFADHHRAVTGSLHPHTDMLFMKTLFFKKRIGS